MDILKDLSKEQGAKQNKSGSSNAFKNHDHALFKTFKDYEDATHKI